MLTNRWTVLALLFAVRTGMGFQFQSVPALSPLYIAEFAVTVAEIGLLIGLYHAPGIALALPGGAIGRWLGDTRGVAIGLLLMTAGSLMMALVPIWEAQLAGRVVAGTGGVVLNVLMTKLVADWFSGKEIATAMGIFVNSWPVGIALALLTLPHIALASNLKIAVLTVALFTAVGLAAIAMLYRPPSDGSGGTVSVGGVSPRGTVLAATLTAGLVWGLYNAGLGMIFGFGPLLLVERGWTATEASSMTSVVLWLVAVSVPAGGIIADRTGRRMMLLSVALLGFAALLVAASRVDQVLVMFILLGLVSGLPAGTIMSLPAGVLTPQARAIGMGLFFTVFYSVHTVAPAIAGAVARSVGTVRVTFDIGALFLIVAWLGVLAYRVFAARLAVPTLARA